MKWRAILLIVPYLALGADALAQEKLDREEPFATKPGYVQLFASVYFGDGLRFNNPYRLATPLAMGPTRAPLDPWPPLP